MTLSPRVEKLALVAHVTVSVGWLGAVVAFLALAIVGLTSPDAQTVRAAYLAMDLTAWLLILPLAFASVLSGLVQSLGTRWGLFRHYWVLAKLVITLLSTLILVAHMAPIESITRLAGEATLAPGDHLPARLQMVVASALAVVALLVVTALSVFKPRGMTRHGWRKQQEQRGASPPQVNASGATRNVPWSLPRPAGERLGNARGTGVPTRAAPPGSVPKFQRRMQEKRRFCSFCIAVCQFGTEPPRQALFLNWPILE